MPPGGSKRKTYTNILRRIANLSNRRGGLKVPEFYDETTSKYQPNAQPYLDAIARGLRHHAEVRAFLLKNTEFEQTYADAMPLWQEHWNARDPRDKLICPFWANISHDYCKLPQCRIADSNAVEIDALFFLQNAEGRTLAMHLEMKRDHEALSKGQAESYRIRAACCRDKHFVRKGVLDHDHFITVLFYGSGTDTKKVEPHFDRVISHQEAREYVPNYPGS
jgi:hypothetical protein